MKKDYGFIRSKVDETHYVLGGFSSLPKVVLQPDGKWSQYFPKYEPQFNKYFDAYGCTVWGTENVIETILKRITNIERNFSERFIYILAGIRPPGTDPHTVAECIRKNKLIDDVLLPMTDSFEEFIKPDPMTEALLKKGRELPYEIGHEWVWSKPISKEERIEKIREALKYSPLGVSVTAWYEENGVYVDKGKPNCHWCVLGEETDKGWMIFDSYDQSTKILSFDHNIECAKRYHLTASPELEGTLTKLIRLLKELLGLVQANPKVMESQPAIVDIPPVPPAPVVEQEQPKYLWDTPVLARHSCRVIMDEYYLQPTEKDVLCAVIQEESRFNPKAENHGNKDGSVDYGIIQANSHWYIGPGKPIASIEEALNNPEKCVRVMIKAYQAGHLSDWWAFRSGAYKKHL